MIFVYVLKYKQTNPDTQIIFSHLILVAILGLEQDRQCQQGYPNDDPGLPELQRGHGDLLEVRQRRRPWQPRVHRDSVRTIGDCSSRFSVRAIYGKEPSAY